jgi:hypothetical protein
MPNNIGMNLAESGTLHELVDFADSTINNENTEFSSKEMIARSSGGCFKKTFA